jgi:hypothetical protein
MRELIVSMLMSHDTVIFKHYLRSKEDDMVFEYQKAISLLTINQDENSLNEKVKELEQKYQAINNVLQNLLKSISSVDESGKQTIAKQLIENGLFN